MKRILFILMVVVSHSLFGQSNYEDVVYLKNGSVIHGMIIEQVPSVSLKIKTHDGNIFVYKIDEIEKITKEEPIITTNPVSHTTEKERQVHKDSFDYNKVSKNGFCYATDMGGLFGVGYTNMSYFSWQQLFAGRINNRTYLGAGLNVEVTNRYSVNIYYSANSIPSHSIMLPLYIGGRYVFLKKRISPFIEYNAGYGFWLYSPPATLKEFIGGPMAKVGIGGQCYISKTIAIYLMIAYRFQYLHENSTTYPNWDGFNQTTAIYPAKDLIFNYINLSFGFVF